VITDDILWQVFWLGVQAAVVGFVLLAAVVVGGYVLWRTWRTPKERRHAK
jgi:hypothetical protein